MKFIKLSLNKNYKNYTYVDVSDTEMNILGLFLMDDVGNHPLFYRKWFFNTEHSRATGNAITLEKENDYILLSDLYSEEEIPTELKMTQKQFVQILTDWEEKVLKLKPKEVIIKYKNNEFIFETKD